jgi:hypothetical protein
VLDDVVDVDLLDGILERLHLVDRERRLHASERVAVALVADDLELVVGAGIAERRLEQEPVELRLGQRERAFELDRVLRGQDEERVRERPRDAVDGHLPLGHGLEQRRLRLRHRAVDLVDEDDVGEDRTGPELEVTHLLVEDGQARDVGRLQVRRALDAGRDRLLDRLRDRAREHRLGGARDVLEQDVALTDQRGEHESDLLALAADGDFDVVEEELGATGRALQLRLRLSSCSLRPAAHGAQV